ncbi:MAG: hypothetical protein IPL53_06675 [Ignavibacteria bacterium]|nr:hypothetical protein [Ignavibacteria bacterium]
MISRNNLRVLIEQKLKDEDSLISKRRYSTAFYIAGYAIELALKLKICKIFKFDKGFPENKKEFGKYQIKQNQKTDLSFSIQQISAIKTHDLFRLLFYSGVEDYIKKEYWEEWSLITKWNPGIRYEIRIRKKEAVAKINAIKILIRKIH